MSLEQALAENTAAMNRLVTVLTTATEAQASFAVSAGAAQAAAAPAEAKATRTRKNTAAVAETAAAVTTAAPAATAPAANNLGPVVEGDPDGTRYFVIPKHNTVCAIKPGEVVPNMESQIEVSGANYLIAKAQLAAKFATAPAVTQTTTQAPATTAPSATAQVVTVQEGPTFEQVVAKARELHALKNNEGLMVILNQFGAASVPALQGKAPNAELIAAIEKELTPAPAAAPASFF
ncbi:hypothetical protein [Curvibacter phage PCA1]|nr:hypothetical protein [Curvibacter phage PCA1]